MLDRRSSALRRLEQEGNALLKPPRVAASPDDLETAMRRPASAGAAMGRRPAWPAFRSAANLLFSLPIFHMRWYCSRICCFQGSCTWIFYSIRETLYWKLEKIYLFLCAIIMQALQISHRGFFLQAKKYWMFHYKKGQNTPIIFSYGIIL
jgi:hypothetical protein